MKVSTGAFDVGEKCGTNDSEGLIALSLGMGGDCPSIVRKARQVEKEFAIDTFSTRNVGTRECDTPSDGQQLVVRRRFDDRRYCCIVAAGDHDADAIVDEGQHSAFGLTWSLY